MEKYPAVDKSQIRSTILLLMLLFLTACGSSRNPLTVSEVIQNAEVLDGKTVRVLGMAYLWTDPTQAAMWMFGGCAVYPEGTEVRQGFVKGWMTLYDSLEPEDFSRTGAPDDKPGIRISKSDFYCEGDYCKITCSAFEVVSKRMYELVGVLRAGQGSELILENIDLEQSSQLVDEKWIPLQTGDFEVGFP
jgi:hypothetical protein